MTTLSADLKAAAESLLAAAAKMEAQELIANAESWHPLWAPEVRFGGEPPPPKQPDKAPDGYAFTGEYREPRNGEWFLDTISFSGGAARMQMLYHSALKFWILRKLPTVESTYGKPLSELKPPEGWEFTGEFRTVSGGDDFLVANCAAPACGTFYFGAAKESGPRLILRRKSKPRRRWIFEETGEVRMPYPGEWFDEDGPTREWKEPARDDSRTILRLVERPE